MGFRAVLLFGRYRLVLGRGYIDRWEGLDSSLVAMGVEEGF